MFDNIYEAIPVSQLYHRLTGNQVHAEKKTKCPVCGGNNFQVTSHDKSWTCWSGRCHEKYGKDSVGLFASHSQIERINAAKILSSEFRLSSDLNSFPNTKNMPENGRISKFTGARGTQNPEPYEIESWATALDVSCQAAHERLMRRADKASRRAWDYLTGPERNLTSETIERNGLGFNPEWLDYHEPLPGRSKHCKLPAGIVIPWYAGPLGIAGANVRQFHMPLSGKYVMATGSRRRWMYPSWTVENPEKPILIVEGEFDAMLGGQLLGHECIVITAGSSTAEPRMLHWSEKHKFSKSQKLFISSDNDTAGIACQQMWLNYTRRVSPIALPNNIKDLSEAYAKGVDIKTLLLDRMVRT